MTSDKFDQIAADHLARHKSNPNIYFLSGIRGVGRKTFAVHYMRRALSGNANLPFGPALNLPVQAELNDIRQALRAEINPNSSLENEVKEKSYFETLSVEDKIKEIVKLFTHFSNLGQAVTLISTSGFFEEAGKPKAWLVLLLKAIPKEQTVFVVSGRQLPTDVVDSLSNTIQMRVDELSDKDIRSLMIFTADRLDVENFNVSAEMIQAIGGHADTANAAVKLAKAKGMYILEKDPRQIFNIQNTIFGEVIDGASLNQDQKIILSILGWVPSLSGDLIAKILTKIGIAEEKFIKELEELILGCLVGTSGANYSISPSIRIMFRRAYPTPDEVMLAMSEVMHAEWKKAKDADLFRLDLFETFVFMHSLEGKSLPAELRPLLNSGMLAEVVRDTYARGKGETDTYALRNVISWGAIADHMNMDDATREDILSNMAKAHIRLGEYPEAERITKIMQDKEYRSAAFLKGYSLRKQEQYLSAIPLLEEALRLKKTDKSTMHELAIAYKKEGKIPELQKLLAANSNIVRDSAMFADFQIGLDLARGDLPAAERGIILLKTLPDNEGRSGLREAQVLMKKGLPATQFLTKLIEDRQGNSLQLRATRAYAAVKEDIEDMARQDIDFIRSIPGRRKMAIRLDASYLINKKQPIKAKALMDEITNKTAEDWLVYAQALEAEAEMPETPLSERKGLKDRAIELKREYGFSQVFDFAV